ncbi:MAG: response regulator receiver protein [Chitinophagaceae bacterium]|nr:response regulator receiver protein [Chitinophagaceae bacterium]
MNAPIRCLIAEDDVDDQEIFSIAVSELDGQYDCTYTLNGIEALERLSHDTLLPHYIFLDLNMPRMNGIQCLAEIKKQERLLHIPVVIYSTSSGQSFIDDALHHGAATFITKPSRISDLVTVLNEFFTSQSDKK